MNIRLINEKDYRNVSDMIGRAIENSDFAKFYPQCSIDYLKEILNEQGVKERAEANNFYVIETDGEIVACGAIGLHCGDKTECCLHNIFVDSRFQGRGLGRKIIEVLENDKHFVEADRVEVAASISAVPFYRKMGYKHKNGELLYDDGRILMEKYNNK